MLFLLNVKLSSLYSELRSLYKWPSPVNLRVAGRECNPPIHLFTVLHFCFFFSHYNSFRFLPTFTPLSLSFILIRTFLPEKFQKLIGKKARNALSVFWVSIFLPGKKITLNKIFYFDTKKKLMFDFSRLFGWKEKVSIVNFKNMNWNLLFHFSLFQFC